MCLQTGHWHGCFCNHGIDVQCVTVCYVILIFFFKVVCYVGFQEQREEAASMAVDSIWDLLSGHDLTIQVGAYTSNCSCSSGSIVCVRCMK